MYKINAFEKKIILQLRGLSPLYFSIESNLN